MNSEEMIAGEFAAMATMVAGADAADSEEAENSRTDRSMVTAIDFDGEHRSLFSLSPAAMRQRLSGRFLTKKKDKDERERRRFMVISVMVFGGFALRYRQVVDLPEGGLETSPYFRAAGNGKRIHGDFDWASTRVCTTARGTAITVPCRAFFGKET